MSETAQLSSIDRIKHHLICVFDDNLHTRVWHNVVDWTIIFLIVVSSLEVFLSTFESITDRIGPLLHFIDLFTTIVFTIEVTLRIWTADLLDPRYRGVSGRLRYCFSFYGLIDILSTYPFYLSFIIPLPVVALKILRVARLFRIFRYVTSFQILGKAVASKRQELSISVMFLGILTVILSFLLYFAEHDAQPELCENGWQTLVWAFAKYLGDPGKIADFPLVTFWGHFIAAMVGILGIAIFAVPAGLIGSGFVEVIEERNHNEKIQSNIERIRHAFRWEKDQQYTGLFHVPPFRPMDNLLVKQFIPESDVVEAVRETPSLHLYNLAKAYNSEDEQNDRVVVVACPSNRPYGCCIDRKSMVTIVSTSGSEEPITSWVAYHIAKLGGFNYIAKELEPDPDNPVSYYNITDESSCPNLQMFMDDVNRLSSAPDSWVIPMCFCVGPKSRPHKVHLCYSSVRDEVAYDSPTVTFVDDGRFDAFARELSEAMENEFSLAVDRNKYYVVNKKDNILRRMACRNGFALRMECYPIYFAADRMAKIKRIAEIIGKNLEPGIERHLPEEMLSRPKDCFGYNAYRD